MYPSRLVVVAATVLFQAGDGGFAFIARSSVAAAGKLALKKAPLIRPSVPTMSGGDQHAEVIVVGSCNTDLMTYTSRLPSRGENPE